METQEILTQLCRKYDLGEIQNQPESVAGGLLHRMYHVVTDRGDYAIKLLNPDIMKRPDARQNMINSERIAHVLADIVPAAAALELQGQHLLSLSLTDTSHSDALTDPVTRYAMVYPWLEGRSLFAPEITVAHCGKVGRILGLMHRADIRLEGLEKEKAQRSLYDWQGYLALAKTQQVTWLADYEAMLPDLIRWDHAAVDAMDAVNAFQVISHRDLDPKNILWQDFAPCLIDWEAAGYVNPYQELLEVLNYWGVNEKNEYDPSLCRALLQEYAQIFKLAPLQTQYDDLRRVGWAPVFACSYDSMLGWLEYTLKKSLGLEGDEDARSQSVSQLPGVYADLQRYEDRADSLLEIIRDTL